MVPFNVVCPELASDEVRTISVSESEFLPQDTYALLEIYCEELDCDCRRVMLKVISKRRGREEANISFGFDPKGRMPGPFLDPINVQGPYSNVLLEYVAQILQFDKQYVARLERHYKITKQICSGQIQSSDAKPSPRLTEVVPLDSIVARAEHRRSLSENESSRSHRADRENKKRQRQARKRNRH